MLTLVLRGVTTETTTIWSTQRDLERLSLSRTFHEYRLSDTLHVPLRTHRTIPTHANTIARGMHTRTSAHIYSTTTDARSSRYRLRVCNSATPSLQLSAGDPGHAVAATFVSTDGRPHSSTDQRLRPLPAYTSSTQTAVRRWCAILIERRSVGLRVPMLGASALRATKPSSSNRHSYNARLHPSRSCTLAAAGIDGPGYPHKQPRGRELTVGLRASLTGLDPTIIQLVEMEATPHPK